MKHLFEVCTGSLPSVEAAVRGGAQRIELCSALPLDGLTPSIGILQAVRCLYPTLTIHVLIRPREGDFVYTEEEVLAMERDIHAMLPSADGFVCGALTADGGIDMTVMQRLMDAAEGKPVTFHRAFDHCRDPFVAMEQIISLGCRRILTSGQQSSAEQGIPLLRQLIEQAQGRIIIMPGGGVNEENVRLIANKTGATELHGSASGGTGVTNAETVKRIIELSDGRTS